MSSAQSRFNSGSAAKKATNASLNAAFVEQAETVGVNVSHTCERGLALQIAEVQAQRQLEENKQALASSNAYVDSNGLPLDDYRQF